MSGPWAEVLRRLVAGQDLDGSQAEGLLRAVVAGDVDERVVAGLLVALAAKGESADEVAGFVRAMRAAAVPLELDGPLLDTCGTGGDGAGTFNISTVAAVVCAAAGARVAKHGNRASSGRAGSADLLEAWGVALELPPAGVATCVEELRIGFLFAPAYHPAMRHVGPTRRALGIRTVFNVLGPISNPAGVSHQLVGVAHGRLGPVVAGALARLGTTALVVHGRDGLDELTTTTVSTAWRVADGRVTEDVLDPRDLDLGFASPEDLAGGDVVRNREVADEVLGGQPGPAADVVALNAAAALHVAGHVDDLGAGVARAREVLGSGAAADLRDRWVARSRELASST